jgi:hypothetical protein
MQARSSIVAHLAPTRPELQERIAMMARALIARGVDAASANSAALAALSGQVQRQAATLAFDKLFLLAGIVFLIVLPLLAFLKVPRGQSLAPPVSAANPADGWGPSGSADGAERARALPDYHEVSVHE